MVELLTVISQLEQKGRFLFKFGMVPSMVSLAVALIGADKGPFLEAYLHIFRAVYLAPLWLISYLIFILRPVGHDDIMYC